MDFIANHRIFTQEELNFIQTEKFNNEFVGKSNEKEFERYLKDANDLYADKIEYTKSIVKELFGIVDIFRISHLGIIYICSDSIGQYFDARSVLHRYGKFLKQKRQAIQNKFTSIDKDIFLAVIHEFLTEVDKLAPTGKTTGSKPSNLEKAMNEILQKFSYVCSVSFGQSRLASNPSISFCPTKILDKDLINGKTLSAKRGVFIWLGYAYQENKITMVIGWGDEVEGHRLTEKIWTEKRVKGEWKFNYERKDFTKIKEQIADDFLYLVNEFNQIPLDNFKPSNLENKGQTMINDSRENSSKNPPLNQILYGPPGTGKTYSTINKALEILGVETQDKSRAELKAKFDEFRQNGQIEFVTFHQSFSYEEFVEGIKPKFINSNEGAESSKMEYEIKSGIFKQICDRAKQYTKEFVIDQQVVKPYVLDKNKTLWRLYTLPDAKIDNDFFDECIKNGCVKAYYDYGGVALSEKAQNGDYVVIPSTNYGEMSKTIRAFGILRDNDIKQTKENEIYYKNVEWLWVAKDENEIIRFDKVNFNRPTFQRVKQGKESIIDYMDILLDKNKESFTTKPCILIIDEINRGNISKILGELITLIEPSKRIGASEEEKARGIGNESLKVTLPYSNESFGVPSNLYIIGTMNTADRSIALLDTALRRRFEFVEMMPNYEELRNIWLVNEIGTKDSSIESWEGIKGDDGIYRSQILFKILTAINNRIEFLLDREHTIGHAFFFEKAKFCQDDEWGKWYELTLESLKEIFVKKIIPLLQEYFYDDYAKIDAVLNKNEMIKPFSMSDLDVKLSDEFVDSEKRIYRITDFSSWDIDTFTQIYGSKNTDKSNENE